MEIPLHQGKESDFRVHASSGVTASPLKLTVIESQLSVEDMLLGASQPGPCGAQLPELDGAVVLQQLER